MFVGVLRIIQTLLQKYYWIYHMTLICLLVESQEKIKISQLPKKHKYHYGDIMRLYELFNTPGMPQGIANILNIPDAQKNQNAPMGASNGIIANTTPMVANNTANISTQISPDLVQKLSKGSTITAPTGPSKQPTQLKITNVVPSNTPGTPSTNKDVTVVDPRKPNQPGITYKYSDLANALSSQNK